MINAMDRLKSNGQMIDQIDLRNVPHSAFDRSNHNYGSGKLGCLIPCRLDEVYPGDRIKGRPHIVENFEPLAAPLMGTMILKQESFFVPYIQLWRHAWKFFTGKNGFSENMPMISPLAILNVYKVNVHKYLLGDYGEDAAGDGQWFIYLTSALNAFRLLLVNDNATWTENFGGRDQHDFSYFVKGMVTNLETMQSTVYGPRKMVDLVQPIIDVFKRYARSEEVRSISMDFDSTTVSKETKLQHIKTVVLALGDLIKQYLDFFHGPSSLCDYLGWPVVSSWDLPQTIENAALEDGVSNIIQYIIWYNTFVSDYSAETPTESELEFWDNIDSFFSQVPLVFNPFKAYYLIWYWNYRDQLLETDILDPEEDEFLGSTITDNVVLYCTLNRQRCWLKDTFTTALTHTGDGNLLVPTLDVSESNSEIDVSYYDSDGNLVNTSDSLSAIQAGALVSKIHADGITYSIPMNYLRGALDDVNTNTTGMNFISLDMFDRIKRLRNVVMKRSILGYEVDDVVYSSFLVKMSNIRMHIPEILSRGRDIVQMNTVVNNTSTAQQIAGDKTATAWCDSVGSEINYFSEDWGLFLTIKTTMPVQSYAGGLQRLYLKSHNLDYMWPEFAAMGMDAVYNTELAAIGTHLTDEQGLMVFGYQGRYYDLKSRQDEVHGRLLTDLNYLTFSREFDKNNPPKLNYIFVHSWPRLDGFVLEDPSQDVFRYDCYNESNWERRLPVPSEFV